MAGLTLGGRGPAMPSPLPSNTVPQRIAYTGPSADDYANLERFSDRQLRDIVLYGANAATAAERARIKREAERELARRTPTTTAPTSNGMQADGRQRGVTVTAPAEKPSIKTDYTPTAQTVSARPADSENPTVVLFAPPNQGGDKPTDQGGLSAVDLLLLDAMQTDTTPAPRMPSQPAPANDNQDGGGAVLLPLLLYGLTLL